jgi:LmbE family N-acetylglucosaminyl deacetylase
MDRLWEIPDPVLVICAHPDDIEVHAGGTIARLVQAGRSVAYVLATRGDRGTSDPTRTPAEVASIREAEQRAAAAILGIDDLTFLNFRDGDLMYAGSSLREALVRCIRHKRPRAIITHDPFPGNGSPDACAIHPDHLTLGYAVFQAAFIAAPAPLFYPDHLAAGLRPWRPEAIYCVMSSQPDLFVDITPVWPQKWEAIRQHRSQGRHLPEMEPFFRAIARRLGEQIGCDLAEGFRLLRPP